MEYYGLLGLPLFTSDAKEIKAAHRRVVKMVHPDILGVNSSSALQQIVTEAYNTLSDPEERVVYDEKLRKAKPTLAQSNWSDDTGVGEMGVFVDETECTRCYKCVYVASSTFAIHTDRVRDEKAYVRLQYGDAVEIVKEAVKNCPSKAIRWVQPETLPLLEFAMVKSAKLRARAIDDPEAKILNPLLNTAPPGPFDILQDFMMDDLLELDMDKERESADVMDPMKDSRLAEELSDKAREIYQAAMVLPPAVVERLWPQTADASSMAKKATTREPEPGSTGDYQRVEKVTPGLGRAELKVAVFRLFDKDGDDFLYAEELRKFAFAIGFEGGDADWTKEYAMLCAELGCSTMEGLNLGAFSRMVDDEDGCFLTDSELASLLSDSRQLKRAASGS